jgi:hypothetical protein
MHTITEDDAGFGYIKYENGIEYEGRIYGAIPHGEGKMKDNKGSSYEGAFFHGMPQGEGTWRTPDGIVAWGRWELGQFRVLNSIHNTTSEED